MEKIIWTFWEPRDKIPAYLELCMQTWEKFLPEYKINLLDYSNYEDYIGKDFYDESFKQNFSLPKQADAIRAAVLSKYGGVWFDVDTIIASEQIREILELDTEFVIGGFHIGFLCAKKAGSIVSRWTKECQKRILEYKSAKEQNDEEKLKELDVWYALGNAFVTPLVKECAGQKEKCIQIDRDKYFLVSESNYYKNKKTAKDSVGQYVEFYFHKDFSDYVISRAKYLIMLHNSWTPQNYKQMSADLFFRQNSTISKLLRAILYGNDNDGIFVTTKGDGNSSRLLNLMQTFYLAKKLYNSSKVKFVWTELATGNKDREIIDEENKFVKFPSIDKKETIFSRDFLYKHFLPSIDYSKPHLIIDDRWVKDFEEGKKDFNSHYTFFAVTCKDLSHIYKDNKYRKQMKDIFESIDFTDKIKQIKQDAKRIASSYKKFAAIHMRTGDNMYIPSIYRTTHPFNYHGLTAGQVVGITNFLLQSKKYDNIILFSDDGPSIKEVAELINAEKVIHFGVISKEYNKKLSEFEQYLFEVMLMSFASDIYGTSQPPKFAHLINTQSNFFSAWQVFSKEEQYKIEIENYERLKLNASHKAYSLMHLFLLANSLQYDKNICLSYLEQALAFDEENDKYRIYKVDYLLTRDFTDEAEEYIRSFKTRLNLFLNTLLFQTYWTGINFARFFNIYEKRADKNYPYISFVAAKIALHKNEKSKAKEFLNYALEKEPNNVLFLKLQEEIYAKNHTQQIQDIGAVDRVKNHLAYKLGQAMIFNSKSFLGYIRMLYVLSYIKAKHKAEQKDYETKIAQDPNLKLPKLEIYDDYEEALKIKEHLSYKLGEALIKRNKEASNNIFKFMLTGGGLLSFYMKDVPRLKSKIKEKKQKS